ncbi:hypothetical protein QM027_06310 [Campylobacter concisus]
MIQNTATLLCRILTRNLDDNNDNNMLNDVDDFFEALYFYDKNTHQGTFALIPKQAQGLYSISIVDHGTNFQVLLVSTDFSLVQTQIQLASIKNFTQDHTKLRAYSKPVVGNNEVANKMIQASVSKADILLKWHCA